MIYTKTVTSPKGGSANVPTLDRMAVTKGLIYQFELYFPPGSSGLLKVAITDGSYPLYPSEPSEWLFGDNTLISFPDRYFIQTPDQVLQIWHYNEDDTYDHMFQIRIGQVLAEQFIASFLPGYGQKDTATQIAEMIASQEEQKTLAAEALVKYFTGNPEATILEESD